jgi:hypothetical protein
MSAHPLVLVGAAGWLHPGWRGSFYPGDLPDDWLLSYYNTQYSAVYLPAAAWQTVSDTTWAQWLHDTQEGFHFVLEPGDAGTRKPASSRTVIATPEWAAQHIWWLDETPDLRALARRITQQAATGEPLFVFSRSGTLSLLEQANTLRQVMGY